MPRTHWGLEKLLYELTVIIVDILPKSTLNQKVRKVAATRLESGANPER